MILLKLIGVAALALPFTAGAALVWDDREINVGGKATDREIVANYRFRSAGPAPVAITEVISDCECMTMELSKRVYAPGEEGTLTARLAIGNRSGLQQNTIAVVTDDLSAEPAVLRLRANIQSLVAITPQALSWRVGGDPEERSVLVATATPLRIAALMITGTYPAGAATARMEILAEGGEYRVLVRPTSPARTLNFTVACAATFTDGTVQEFVLYAMVRR